VVLFRSYGNVTFDGGEPLRAAEAVNDRDRAEGDKICQECGLLSGDDDASTVVTLQADSREQCLVECLCARVGKHVLQPDQCCVSYAHSVRMQKPHSTYKSAWYIPYVPRQTQSVCRLHPTGDTSAVQCGTRYRPCSHLQMGNSCP
jgi:hypothetical protein